MQKILEENDRQKWLLPLNINTTINCWVQLHELTSLCQYDRTYLKLQNFAWITIFTMKFYKVMPRANIFSSYCSYIHEISKSQRNDFLKLNDMRTEHRTENPIIYWLNRWNFSWMNILKLQNSISWQYCKWTNSDMNFTGQKKTVFKPSKTEIL